MHVLQRVEYRPIYRLYAVALKKYRITDEWQHVSMHGPAFYWRSMVYAWWSAC